MAETTASAKVRSTHTGLSATGGLIDLTGARSTSTGFALDRFRRNPRRLSLHDPVAYRRYEIGQFVVNGQSPAPPATAEDGLRPTRTTPDPRRLKPPDAP